MKRERHNKSELVKSITTHIRELQKMRQMASMLMLRLKREIKDTSGEKALKQCIDEMAKLSQMQLKIIPLETELIQMLPQQKQENPQRMAEDEAILAKAFQRWQEAEPPHG